MSITLRDYLVFCDMDNTLLTAKEGVPTCNRTVIHLFTSMGGRFTVATGRPPESIRAALGDIQLSLPAISCNGALLYDFKSNTVLRRSALEQEQATAAIRDILEKFPQMGVEVMAGAGQMYVIHPNRYTHAHQVDEKLPSVACPLENVPDGWVKAVFASDPDTIRKLQHYTKTHYYGRDNYFLPTNTIYFELMPAGVSKATGLRDLCTVLGDSPKKTIVIGDYFNDLELMKAAGHSVAVANAPAEVKNVADEVTICTCRDGAVGEYLYKLIASVGK
ncbi:MAG: HAD family hydrolase [Gemmiger sp.]|nr:HAD family hydrolase [Gemmiger sp.]